VSLRPITVLVSASGAPGTAALLGALRRNGERDLRLVGTDMSERSVGRHLCDAFHIVPAGSDPGFPDAMREVVERERVDVVLPQSSFDLEGLAAHRERFPVPVLVSRPDTIHRSNDKAESYALLHRIGVPAPEFRRVNGAAEVADAAHELGYPDRPVCFKPVFSSGSRGFFSADSASFLAAALAFAAAAFSARAWASGDLSTFAARSALSALPPSFSLSAIDLDS